MKRRRSQGEEEESLITVSSRPRLNTETAFPSPVSGFLQFSHADIATEYIPLLSEFPDFSICADHENNKWVRSTRAIEDKKDILVEAPMLCWPIACSVTSWKSIIFCEHCLKIIHEDVTLVTVSPGMDGKVSLCNTTSTAFHQKQTQDFSPSFVPSLGSFCSAKCVLLAVEGGIPGSEFGWFTLIGGAEGLRRLRESEWGVNQEDGPTIRSLTPIPIESIARYLCVLVRRFCVLKKQQNIADFVKIDDECLENQLFIEAGRPFERLITSAVPSHYNPSRVAEIITSVIGHRLSAYLSDRLVTMLLQPESIAQISGQLHVNSQTLHIWGADLTGTLCVLKGAGVFTLQSCINHSCIPNCTVSTVSDSTITVSSIRDIPPLEHITIAYIKTDLPLEDRRHLLASNYCFWCECQKCLQEEHENERQRRS